MTTIQRLLLALCILAPVASGQHRVDSRNTLERVVCVVPMVGAGTPKDPRRPQYAPWPPAKGQSPTDILAYSHQVSDDGRFALVEFVARDRKAFQAIFNDKTVKVFEKGKDKRDDLEKELKKFRKDFDLNKFGAVAR